ncbi:NAD(P)H-quinone oxidoreductase [Lautropia dentalis]|uniref:NAD(P)H-quinone oxidoreductase n=1 Tax=Lautropia dentalis TaxID=2490857 RepID=A0A426FMJ5_9BURK|nr:NAD(P)H-quinone oxidoreductase [Lautropia dentalis]RRN43917.1 NAD(P)H-quinone oxidoreductase [Lautropia dentalis]
MKYIDHGRGGDADVLRLAERDLPEVGAGEVLIRVAYAGVNRPDVLQRAGSYPPPRGASPHLGLEVAGVVAAVGQGVPEWQKGDRVCALVNGGGYAEYVAAPAGQVLPVPAGLSMAQAAALPETVLTVWANVVERGRLQAGETLLVHGGTSGIGVAAIQIAKALGARVFCTVGTPEKAGAAQKLGADAAIDYRRRDFMVEVSKLTEGRGVDVILDMVGGPYIERNLRSLALEGRLVQIAFMQTAKVEVDWMPLMLRRLTFTGSTLRARSAEEKARLSRAVQDNVWPMVEDGRVQAVIDRVFPLDSAAEAHRRMESSDHVGKILLAVNPGIE